MARDKVGAAAQHTPFVPPELGSGFTTRLSYLEPATERESAGRPETIGRSPLVDTYGKKERSLLQLPPTAPPGCAHQPCPAPLRTAKRWPGPLAGSFSIINPTLASDTYDYMEHHEGDSHFSNPVHTSPPITTVKSEPLHSSDVYLPNPDLRSSISPPALHPSSSEDMRHILPLPDGAKFSIDEEPSNFSLYMFRAMRSRILELEHALNLNSYNVAEPPPASSQPCWAQPIMQVKPAPTAPTPSLHPRQHVRKTSSEERHTPLTSTPVETTWHIEQPGPENPRPQSTASTGPLSRIYFTRFAPYNSPTITSRARSQKHDKLSKSPTKSTKDSRAAKEASATPSPSTRKEPNPPVTSAPTIQTLQWSHARHTSNASSISSPSSSSNSPASPVIPRLAPSPTIRPHPHTPDHLPPLASQPMARIELPSPGNLLTQHHRHPYSQPPQYRRASAHEELGSTRPPAEEPPILIPKPTRLFPPPPLLSSSPPQPPPPQQQPHPQLSPTRYEDASYRPPGWDPENMQDSHRER
ncbi:uncharacterized protein VTP21DRAFT_11696 [Calcarisporiella thermophila]|uniref:uncharacterized protein n=1 Tax=Calcarisporiella thermophila TaxID=911321 RepID=UPI0037432435